MERPQSALAERVLFPAGPHETRGMEDARFVRFIENEGITKYYAMYTACDEFQILLPLIEIEDFSSFTISTLNGATRYQSEREDGFPAQNKSEAT